MEDRMNKDKLMMVKNDLNEMEELLSGIKVEKADDNGRMDEKKVWTTHENMAVLKILQKKLSLVHNLLLHEEDTIYSSDYAFEPGKSTTLEEVELLKDQYDRIFQQFNNIISNVKKTKQQSSRGQNNIVNSNNNNNQSRDDNSNVNCDDNDDNVPRTTNIISCSSSFTSSLIFIVFVIITTWLFWYAIGVLIDEDMSNSLFGVYHAESVPM